MSVLGSSVKHSDGVPERVPTRHSGTYARRVWRADHDLGEVVEDVAGVSVRLVSGDRAGGEVTEFLGRTRYERGDCSVRPSPTSSTGGGRGQRRVADGGLEYLYLDASQFRFHDGARAEPVMVAYGVNSDDTLRLLSLEAVSAESHDAVGAFLRVVVRGLRPPLVTIIDGAADLIPSVEQVFFDSLQERGVIHRCRNLLAKVSTPDRTQDQD